MSVKPVILCEAKGMTMSEIKKNDEFEIEITDMSNDGEGIGHANGMTFFVKDAVVGDVIIAGATKLKKTYGYMLEQLQKKYKPEKAKEMWRQRLSELDRERDWLNTLLDNESSQISN